MREYKRETVVNVMRSWLGLKESDGSHKKVIDIYNERAKQLGIYQLNLKDAWCAAAYSAAFHAVGYDAICPTDCSCGGMVAKAKASGIWVEDDNYLPAPGDGVLYDWDAVESGGDCIGWPDHIGMVESVSGNTIVVIEGNYQDSVKRRTIPRGYKYIRGFVTPKFTDSAPAAPAGFSLTITKTTVKRGSTGADVRLCQILLNGFGYTDANGAVLELDGEAGSCTVAAIKKYQTASGLDVDGCCGPKTWSKLLD